MSTRTLLNSIKEDLKDSNSDLRKELQCSLIPLVAYIFDAAQYNAASFTLKIDWPPWIDGVVKMIGNMFYFGFPVVDVGYHLTFHGIMVCILISALPVVIPTQQILVVLGDGGAQVLFGLALIVQTVGMMPCVRFLLRSMGCYDDGPYFITEEGCYEGAHLYYTMISPMLFIILVFASIKWEILTTSPIEMAKQDKVFLMSTRDSPYSIQMLIIKILFVLPLSILEPVLSTTAKILSLLVACLAALACLLVHRPFYYVNVQSALVVPLVMASCNNVLATLVLFLPEEGSSPLVIAYMVFLWPSMWIAYRFINRMFVRDRLFMITKEVVPEELAAKTRRGKRRSSNNARSSMFKSETRGSHARSPKPSPRASASTPTPKKSLLASFRGAQIDPAEFIAEKKASMVVYEGIRKREVAVHNLHLDKCFLGLTKEAVMQYADLLRRIRLGGVSLRYNEFSMLTFSVVNAAILSSSRHSLVCLDLSNNRTMFVKGLNETESFPSFASKNSSGFQSFVKKKGGLSPARHNENNEVNYGENTSSLFSSLELVDPCAGLDVLLRTCTALRKVSFKKTFLPFRVFKKLVEAIRESTIEDLDLTETHLEHMHSFLVGKILLTDKLRRLSLRYNRIGERGTKHIATIIPKTTKLENLDMGWNNMGAEGAQALIGSVARYIKLNIDCNTIPRAAFVRLQDDIFKLHQEYEAVRERSITDGTPPLEELLKENTIVDLLGGDRVVEKIVDRFYVYLVTDPSLAKYFRNISMGRMRHLQSSYIARMLGSKVPYRGRELLEGHKHLGVSNDHFDQTATWFLAAVKDCAPDCPRNVLELVNELVFNLRDKIVTKDMKKEKSVFFGLGQSINMDEERKTPPMSPTSVEEGVAAYNEAAVDSRMAQMRLLSMDSF